MGSLAGREYFLFRVIVVCVPRGNVWVSRVLECCLLVIEVGEVKYNREFDIASN